MQTNIQLTKNFNLNEFVRTNTGLDNNPTAAALENITKLSKILQQIRDEYGKPIHITSGYRSPAVNKKVGGVFNSDHIYGAAVDIVCDRNDILWEIICHQTSTKQYELRQILWEYGNHLSPAWIHISINNTHNKHKSNEIKYIGIKPRQ